IEDRLSDALHKRITQRFVDRRSAFLVRHLAADGDLLASVDTSGEVRVEGTYVGRLDGCRFVPAGAAAQSMVPLITAANRGPRCGAAPAARVARTPPSPRRRRARARIGGRSGCESG